MKAKRLRSLLLLVTALTACTTAGRPDLSGMSFSDEPLIGKFVWYDLVTEDADAARSFYGGLFGWTFEETTGAAGNPYVLAKSGGVYVGGFVPTARRADGKRISRWLPYVSVDDVDAAVTRSTARGGRVAAAPRDVALGRVAAVIDPQGAVVGLARSDIGDPDDATTRGARGRVVWTELLADGHTAAASFYVDVVGYQASVIERRGGEYILLQSDGVNRGGVLQNPAEGWDPAWLTYFGVADPVAAAARAESLGGRILLAPSAEVREGTIAIVADPSGAILALQKTPT
jgi:predicted enzyme related to lactoylglutathione lyase